MFRVTSDLSMILRREFSVADESNLILASGVSGSWATLVNGYATFPTAVTEFAYPIWNESNRNGTVGWTPDVTNSKKVAVLVGKFFAQTDQVNNGTAIAVGDGLEVEPNTGKLRKKTTGPVVAYCTVAPRSVTYLGHTFENVIDYVTI